MVAAVGRAARGRFGRPGVGRKFPFILNFQLSRSEMFAELGLGGSSGLDRPGRDLNKECGYPFKASVRTYARLYAREPFAKRVVDAFADECWAVQPEIYEREDARVTKFERRWKEVNERALCLHFLHRADRLSGIGRFGIVLLGLDDGRPLDQPVRGVSKSGGISKKRPPRQTNLLYLRVFSEEFVRIAQLDDDENSPRFGEPVYYDINFLDPAASTVEGRGTEVETGGAMINRRVHWTRVVHVADNREGSEVYGVPRMQPVLNRLLDLRKILGASPEMLWKGGFPGISFETVPELLGESTMDEDSLRDQVVEYMEGLKRYLALDGVTAKSLLPQVADPTNHVTVQVQSICACIQVPMRIFLGSEAGHLASTQDITTWNRRIASRQRLYLEPRLIRPFINRLIACGVINEPPGGYTIAWRDLNTSSDTEKADVSLKKSQALMQYVSGGCESVMTPRTFFVSILGMSPEEAEAAIDERDLTKKTYTDPLGEKAMEMETASQVKIAKVKPTAPPVIPSKGGARLGGKGPQGGGRKGNPPRRSPGRPAKTTAA